MCQIAGPDFDDGIKELETYPNLPTSSMRGETATDPFEALGATITTASMVNPALLVAVEAVSRCEVVRRYAISSFL